MAVLAMRAKREQLSSPRVPKSQSLASASKLKKVHASRPLNESQVTSTHVTSLSASRDSRNSNSTVAQSSKRRLAMASPTTRNSLSLNQGRPLHESTASLFEESEDRAVALR